MASVCNIRDRTTPIPASGGKIRTLRTRCAQASSSSTNRRLATASYSTTHAKQHTTRGGKIKMQYFPLFSKTKGPLETVLRRCPDRVYARPSTKGRGLNQTLSRVRLRRVPSHNTSCCPLASPSLKIFFCLRTKKKSKKAKNAHMHRGYKGEKDL